MVSYDLIIVGGGPAGLTAALYAGRSRLNTLLIEKMAVGGSVLLAGWNGRLVGMGIMGG